jgi:hypothetical protein
LPLVNRRSSCSNSRACEKLRPDASTGNHVVVLRPPDTRSAASTDAGLTYPVPVTRGVEFPSSKMKGSSTESTCCQWSAAGSLASKVPLSTKRCGRLVAARIVRSSPTSHRIAAAVAVDSMISTVP